MEEDGRLALAICAGFALILASIIGPIVIAEHVDTLAHIDAGHCQIGSNAWIPCAAFRTEETR
jgi:hypothetical protein